MRKRTDLPDHIRRGVDVLLRDYFAEHCVLLDGDAVLVDGARYKDAEGRVHADGATDLGPAIDAFVDQNWDRYFDQRRTTMAAMLCNLGESESYVRRYMHGQNRY